MRRSFLIIVSLFLLTINFQAQQKTNPTPAPTQTQQRPVAVRQNQVIDLTEYGIRIQPDKRLIIMMAALEVAGLDTKEKTPSLFRQQVRKDLADVDPDLRRRMREFVERSNKTLSNPAEQVARYVSLAYAMGQPPTLESPQRSSDLPGEVLEILDFAPLVREFYNRSNIDALLSNYVRQYQSVGDERLRQPTGDMVHSLLAYLHITPQLVLVDRVEVKNPNKKDKNKLVKYEVREHTREFYIVPDLLAVPGTLNFRIIEDSYYAVVPFETNPTNSELRRAYLQFLIDPVILKNSKEISQRRTDIRRLIEARLEVGGAASADVFLTVTRSLIAAIDVREQESSQIISLTNQARAILERTEKADEKAAITKELREKKAAIEDESIAQLSEAYERGALLAFYFANKLKDVESSGFEFTSFFADMISSLNPATEMKRLEDNKVARERALKAREARRAAAAAMELNANNPTAKRRTELLKNLEEIEKGLVLQNYEQAEKDLLKLLEDHKGEPRIFFALGRVASLSARGVTDESVQTERLKKAFAHYKNVLTSATGETEKWILSRSHYALGKILEHFDENSEALKEFDAAIALGEIRDGAYREAVAAKQQLTPKVN